MKNSFSVNQDLKKEFSSQEKFMEYVLMPWNDETTIVVSVGADVTETHSRWQLIEKQLITAKISNVEDLVNVFKSYNVVFQKNGEQEKPSWKCPVLFEYFSQIDESEKKIFFEENGILSTIRNLALQLKELVPKLQLLKTGFNSTIRLHQMQIASILSSAFFCTFPNANANCPSINFITLYEGTHGSVLKYYVEKVKCLMHYFKRIHLKKPSGNLLFHRLHIPDHKFPRWDKTTSNLCSLKVNVDGKIEDQHGFLQMDFANRYVGGGVLGRGCVQEEIRFLISPELIAARLFTECLADNESLFVVGAERYCDYTGYSNTFTFAGNYEDTTPFDERGHRKTYLIIIDALYFHHSPEQYRESKILRELKKAYVGFKPQEEYKTLPLATGNWGCGAFKGDPQLKSLLQIMASSEAHRDILYLTFGNFHLKNQIEEIYSTLKRKAVTVGSLYRIIRLYNKERKKNQTVFEFVIAGIQKLEERKFSSKFVSPTSAEKLTAFEFLPSTRVSKTKLEHDKIEEETSEGFCGTNMNFGVLKKSRDKSKDFFLERNSVNFPNHSSDHQKSGFPLEKHSSILDVIWCESELGYNSTAKEQKEKQTIEIERPIKDNSPSMFSDEDMEITQGDSEIWYSNSETRSQSPKFNQYQIFKSNNEIVNKTPAPSQSKKVIQRKIIDCFFKK